MAIPFTLIVARGLGNEIGFEGRTPWAPCSQDLAHFRRATRGTTCIVGRKTYEKLPLSTILNGRRHWLVLSNRVQCSSLRSNVEVVRGQYEALARTRSLGRPVSICGGAQIYRDFVDLCDRMYVTEMPHSWLRADTHWDFNETWWDEVERRDLGGGVVVRELEPR